MSQRRGNPSIDLFVIRDLVQAGDPLTCAHLAELGLPGFAGHVAEAQHSDGEVCACLAAQPQDDDDFSDTPPLNPQVRSCERLVVVVGDEISVTVCCSCFDRCGLDEEALVGAVARELFEV
jgi:hypothetical protein